MQYRKYGKDGPEVSVLGFGAMRLPSIGWNAEEQFDYTRAKAVIRRALRGGVNFIDSHHNYHGGHSEAAVGAALRNWKGPPVTIQTKTPFYRREPMKVFQGLIERALERLGVDCIDYLLFHSMRMDMFKKRGKGFFRLTDWAMKKGYVRHRGFSSHDTPENVKAFIDTGEFKAMVLSYNWLTPTMAETIAYGARKGMGVAVMNPVGGGALAATTPEVLRLLPGAKTGPDVALRFVLSTPGVCVALSGMSTPKMVDENLATASRKTYMTARQRKAMLKRMQKVKGQFTAVCTSCGYCMPCPEGVNIPQNFLLWNQARYLGLVKWARMRFRGLQQGRHGDRSAFACKQCGQCLPKCPNDIPIVEQLAETAKMLGRRK
jgi:predicted aldo/keto reductase-like oxidoreductase